MGYIVIFALIAAVVWTVSRYLWPYAPCRRCRGSGKNTGSRRRRYGDCGKCGGSGRRRRIGARAVNRAAQDISKRLKGGMRR